MFSVKMTTVPEDLLLVAEDFPLDFKNGCHPEDYTTTDAPMTREHIYHHNRGRHNRLWTRVSWQPPSTRSCRTAPTALTATRPKKV
jgi:hypothetical protein